MYFMGGIAVFLERVKDHRRVSTERVNQDSSLSLGIIMHPIGWYYGYAKADKACCPWDLKALKKEPLE